MTLRDVMTPKVEVVHPDATLQEAAQKMKALDVGTIPVCDGDRLVGIVTDRDMAIRAIADGRDPNTTQVRSVMTPDVVYCFEDQDVAEAARRMQERQIRRLLVLNREKRLVGIVSLGDLASQAERQGGEREEELAEETLEAVSEPSNQRS